MDLFLSMPHMDTYRALTYRRGYPQWGGAIFT